MAACPVCEWFQENYPEEYKKAVKAHKALPSYNVHEKAAWYLLARVKELEAHETAYVTAIHKLNAKLREYGMELP